MNNLQPGELYREQIPFRLITVLIFVFAVLSLGSLGLLIYTLLVGPIGNDPPPLWIYLIEFAVMGGAAFLMYNMRALIIVINYDGMRVSFGSFGKTMSWADIESFQPVEKVVLSGGLHFGPTRRGLGASYTVIGKPAITVKLRSGTLREITFSSTNPEQIMSIMRERTGITSSSN